MKGRNRIGFKASRLEIISLEDKEGIVIAKCKCGNLKYIRAYNIVTNKVKSCGCLLQEYYQKLKKK